MTYSAARGTRHIWGTAQSDPREGATALEYGLMAAAVAGVLIVIAYFLGGKISSSINNVAQHM